MTVSAGHIAKAEAYKKLCMQQLKKRACIVNKIAGHVTQAYGLGSTGGSLVRTLERQDLIRPFSGLSQEHLEARH